MTMRLLLGLLDCFASFCSEVFGFAVFTVRASIGEIVFEGTSQEDEAAVVAFFGAINSFLAAFFAEESGDGPSVWVCHHRNKLFRCGLVVLEVLKVCALAGLILGLAVWVGALYPNYIVGVDGLDTGGLRDLLSVVDFLFVGYGCGRGQTDHYNYEHNERFGFICHVGTSNIIILQFGQGAGTDELLKP